MIFIDGPRDEVLGRPLINRSECGNYTIVLPQTFQEPFLTWATGPKWLGRFSTLELAQQACRYDASTHAS